MESHGLLLDLTTVRIGQELSLKTYAGFLLKDWQFQKELLTRLPSKEHSETRTT